MLVKRNCAFVGGAANMLVPVTKMARWLDHIRDHFSV